MAVTPVEKAFCVLELAKTNSVTVVQRHFRTRYGKPPPTRQSIYDWSKKFQNTGCLCKGKSSGRPPVSEEQVARVRETYTRSPKKSTTRANLESQIPQQIVWKILRKRLKMFPYKLQLVQSLSNNDKIIRHSFYMDMQQRSKEGDAFFGRIMFGD
jgi:transposase